MPTALPVRPLTVRGALPRLVAVVLVLLSSVGLAAPVSADARASRLTSAQERIVVRLIDDICGDTWCEGDHALRFQRFVCHSERRGCTLVVRLGSFAEEPLQWRWRAHRVRGFHRYADMVQVGPDGERSLRPAFFAAVGDAVQAMRSTVPSTGVTPAPGRAAQCARWATVAGAPRSPSGRSSRLLVLLAPCRASS